MRFVSPVIVVCAVFLPAALLPTTHAQEQGVKATSPYPIVLRGEWTFTSSSSLRHYSGEVHIRLGATDAAGLHHGTISYDGQQTNDRCSTKSGFSSDEPVEAQAIREGNTYKVKFTLKCSIGPSPRPFEWNLVGGADGVYSQQLQNSNGSGIILLKRVK